MLITLEGVYVLAYKQNQQTTYHEAIHLFDNTRGTDFAEYDPDMAEAADDGNGWVEILRSWTISNLATLAYLDPDSQSAVLPDQSKEHSDIRAGSAIERSRTGHIGYWTRLSRG